MKELDACAREPSIKLLPLNLKAESRGAWTGLGCMGSGVSATDFGQSAGTLPLGTERTVSIRGEPSHADIWAGRGWERRVFRGEGRARAKALGHKEASAAKQSGSGGRWGQSVRFAFTPAEAGGSGVGHTQGSEHGLAQSANVAPM